ncbi:unnamed protein product, partial [Strongylus vulgaris]
VYVTAAPVPVEAVLEGGTEVQTHGISRPKPLKYTEPPPAPVHITATIQPCQHIVGEERAVEVGNDIEGYRDSGATVSTYSTPAPTPVHVTTTTQPSEAVLGRISDVESYAAGPPAIPPTPSTRAPAPVHVTAPSQPVEGSSLEGYGRLRFKMSKFSHKR